MPITLQPRKESFYFPSSFIAAQLSAILSFASIATIRRYHLQTVFFSHFFIKAIAVIGFVTNSTGWKLIYKFCFNRLFNQCCLSWRSAFNMQCYRIAMFLHNCHYLCPFALFGLPYQGPPFLAGAKVASIKPSSSPNFPCSNAIFASAKRIFSNVPVFRQYCSHLWQV